MNDILLEEIKLYEDESLIALNKPAGMLSIEDGYDRKITNLRSILRETYGAIWAVHRLDKETSGVIIFAKDNNSHRFLNTSFSNRETVKNYRGIIIGFPIWESYEIRLPLKVNGDKNHRTVIDQVNGKPASTYINLLKVRGNYSFLGIIPKTGLTHQIRAHLSAIGFPLLGDHLYWRCCKMKYPSFKPIKDEHKSLFLHAYSLTFTHPISKSLMKITAPLPASFISTLNSLKIDGYC